MLTVPIVGDDDPRITITFTLPVKDGDPVEVKLPRFDFIDEDVLDEIQSAIEGIDSELPAHRAQRQAYLIQMKPFCDDDQFAVVEKLKLGQLTQIMDTWTAKSAISLGEFLASDDSSTENTGRRSGRTSSKEVGGGSTSAAG